MRSKRIIILVLVLALGMNVMPGIPGTQYKWNKVSNAATKTQSDAVSWANAQIGKGLDYDGVYGNQCVDLIKYYYAYFGYANYATGNANAYASNSLPPGWTRVYGNYQPGDVAVWKTNHSCSTCNTGSLGHVGIITSADSVGFNAVNQNFNSQPKCTQNWFYVSALSCAIRPAYGSSVTSTNNITFSEQKVVSVADYNAVVYTKINNPSRTLFSKVGCYLYNEAGVQIKTYSETCTLSTSYVNYNCDFNADMKCSLTPGTTYKYVLYAVVGGKEYKDSIRSFKTSGNTPTVSTPVPTISFKNQKINYVADDNAEVYVYIDNPGKINISKVGCYLYNSNNKLINNYTETCNLSTSYVNFTCNFNGDFGVKLDAGTEYKYILFAIVDGQEIKDLQRTFKTESIAAVDVSNDVETALRWAVDTAYDDKHGYSQLVDRRWGNPDYDCSSFVITAFKNGGFDVSKAMNTRNIKEVFLDAGFTWAGADKINLYDTTFLKRGDVLLKEGSHVEIYLGNGMMVGAHGGSYSIYDENDPGDSCGEEISVVKYSNTRKWDGILRYGKINIPIQDKPSETPVSTESPYAEEVERTPAPTATPIKTPEPTKAPIILPVPTMKPIATSTPQNNKPSKVTLTSVKSSKKGVVVIKWKKTKNADHYYIHCTQKNNDGWQYIAYGNKIRITGLKSKKKYYIKVRAVSENYDYGAWSGIKKVKIK